MFDFLKSKTMYMLYSTRQFFRGLVSHKPVLPRHLEGWKADFDPAQDHLHLMTLPSNILKAGTVERGQSLEPPGTGVQLRSCSMQVMWHSWATLLSLVCIMSRREMILPLKALPIWHKCLRLLSNGAQKMIGCSQGGHPLICLKFTSSIFYSFLYAGKGKRQALRNVSQLDYPSSWLCYPVFHQTYSSARFIDEQFPGSIFLCIQTVSQEQKMLN